MTNRPIRIMVGIVLLLAGVCLWGYGYVRRVDGRSPARWLAYAEQASRRVAYHAEGESMTAGTRASFTLDQGIDGRYDLATRDAKGQLCSLGYDGSQLWYATGGKQEKIAVAPTTETPLPQRARILGTATLAGRPVVQLAVASGRLRKVLAIDRQTGVVLATTTYQHNHLQSSMVVDRVDYRPVAVQPCAKACCTSAQAVDRATLTAHLGGKIAEPHWLPASFTLTDTLLEPCPECRQPMGVLRYSDGLSAITLFEMSRQGMHCDMGSGCCQTGNAQAVVANKTVGAFSVTAVGTVDAATVNKVLNSLR